MRGAGDVDAAAGRPSGAWRSCACRRFTSRRLPGCCGPSRSRTPTPAASANWSTELSITAEPVPMDSQAKYAVLAAGGGEILLRLLSPKPARLSRKDLGPGRRVDRDRRSRRPGDRPRRQGRSTSRGAARWPPIAACWPPTAACTTRCSTACGPLRSPSCPRASGGASNCQACDASPGRASWIGTRDVPGVDALARPR